MTVPASAVFDPWMRSRNGGSWIVIGVELSCRMPIDDGSSMRSLAEAAIVILAAFGYCIFGAFHAVFDGSSAAAISERHRQFLLIYEGLVSVVICTFLIRRGWTARRLGLAPTVARENNRLMTGVNASVAIRLAYHLYQGGIGVIGIIPFGLVCAWWFARAGRLWPVIVAHAVTDATSLLYSSA
jgi:hypothetical protein